jgi:predicted DNA-binding transcriptional regulator AlpA
MQRNHAGNHATCGLAADVSFDPAHERLITDVEAAAFLGCSRATWWRRVKDGTMPTPIRIGGMTRWRLSEIHQVVADLSRERDADHTADRAPRRGT